MQYPTLSENQTSRTMIEEFTGYNHNLRISEGESYDMQNMTCDNYPVLSTRTPRANIMQASRINGMLAKDVLYYVDGTSLVSNFGVVGKSIIENEDGTLSFVYPPRPLELEDSRKTIISMGANILIFPDKQMFNTKTRELTSMEIVFEKPFSTEQVKYSPCTQNGDGISVKGDTKEPENPANGQYWRDTSTMDRVLKRWSESSNMWMTVSTEYLKIQYAGIGKNFALYDSVKISGCTDACTLILNDKTYIIWAKGDDYIVIVAKLANTSEHSTSAPITVSKTIPDFDFATEAGNRLWLCKYGMSDDGKFINEIYASKLGDPTNFNCFMGNSTDSYTVSLGSDGPFTGATTYKGYPIFFKENCIHKIYGTMPSNFQVQTTNERGVQQGSEKSIQIVNEVLYYKSYSDICAYDGSIPTGVSAALGTEQYKNAVAGECGGKYYISMEDDNDTHHLFVYDTNRGIWTHEDNIAVFSFARVGNDLLFFDMDGNLRCVDGERNTWLYAREKQYKNLKFKADHIFVVGGRHRLFFSLSGFIYLVFFEKIIGVADDGTVSASRQSVYIFDEGVFKGVPVNVPWKQPKLPDFQNILFCEEDILYNDKTIFQKNVSVVDGEVVFYESGNVIQDDDVLKEPPFSWKHESGNIGFSYPDNKYIARFNIRLILPEKSTACFSVQYDSSGEWEKLLDMQGSGTRSFTIQAIPHRCDHIRYKIEGRGKCKILSVSKILEQGSDIV